MVLNQGQFPPTPPTALAAGKASWGTSGQQLPARAATTSNPQTVGMPSATWLFKAVFTHHHLTHAVVTAAACWSRLRGI